MKVKKTVTEKALRANRENAKHSTGPETARGKEMSSRNAVTHGLLSRALTCKDEEEQEAYDRVFHGLRKYVRPRNMVQRIKVEDAATAYLRRARSLKLEQRAYRKRNNLGELVGDSIHGNSDLLGTGFWNSEMGWECREIHISGKKSKNSGSKYPNQCAFDGGDEHQFEFQGRFTDPLNTALRYQRATGRDLRRALDDLDELVKSRRHN